MLVFGVCGVWDVVGVGSRWWFQTFCNFHPYLGKISILTSIFFKWGGNHQLGLVGVGWLVKGWKFFWAGWNQWKLMSRFF